MGRRDWKAKTVNPSLKIALVLGLVGLVVLYPFIAGTRRMSEFRNVIRPGMSVEALVHFAGKPSKILRRDQPLNSATRSFKLPPLADHTALYFYPKDGTPYFNVYVFVDERMNTVSRCVVENLWW